jgi:hypothetical protein
VPFAIPPSDTFSAPPASTTVALANPPADIKAVPALLTKAAMIVPHAATTWTPPFNVVPLAMPPDTI